MDQIKDILPRRKRRVNSTLIGALSGAALLAFVALYVYPRYGKQIGQAVSRTSGNLVDRAKGMVESRRSQNYGGYGSYSATQSLSRENEIMESGQSRVDNL